MKNKYSVIIGGDIFPCNENNKLFQDGNIEELFGKEVIDLFNKADYSVLNLEGVLSETKCKQEKTGPVIKSNPGAINAISKLGINALTLANNHITDACQKGCDDTIATIESKGIQWLGIGTKDNMKDSLTVVLGNKKICFYNVTERFWNTPTSNTTGANVYDDLIVFNRLKELKFSSDYVIVIFHAGAERFEYATPLVRERCHRMALAGADIVLTQHTHCIGCEEYFHNSYILYGQGNFVFKNQREDFEVEPTLHGLLIELELTNDTLSIIKHPVTATRKYTVSLDEEPDLTSFYERSSKNENIEWVSKEFQKSKRKILAKFIFDLKGKSFFWKVIRKLFPSHIDSIMLRTYSRKHLLTLKYLCEGDRPNESIVAAIDELLHL